MITTVCECGLARVWHEGSDPLAYREQFRSVSIPCTGYTPRAVPFGGHSVVIESREAGPPPCGQKETLP